MLPTSGSSRIFASFKGACRLVEIARHVRSDCFAIFARSSPHKVSAQLHTRIASNNRELDVGDELKVRCLRNKRCFAMWQGEPPPMRERLTLQAVIPVPLFSMLPCDRHECTWACEINCAFCITSALLSNIEVRGAGGSQCELVADRPDKLRMWQEP